MNNKHIYDICEEASSIKEDKAFLLSVDYEGNSFVSYLPLSRAFLLAKLSKTATVCFGSNRYRFVYGEPYLEIIKP